MEPYDGLPQPWIRQQALAGDASKRQYYRVWDRFDDSAILVHYPPTLRQQLPRDLEVRSWCETRGLRVPALFAEDQPAGWAVVEDFGPRDAEVALQRAAPEDRPSLTRTCLNPLARIAELNPADLPTWNPSLDRNRLRLELAGFELWFLRHHLEVAPPVAVGHWLDELCDAIAHHPTRVCHRDYHINNLFFLGDGEVGLIDYQDMLIGPDTYDAVSLLGERSLPRLLNARQRALVQETWADETGAARGWRERWSEVRMQRALKVLGTFARLEAQANRGYRKWLDDLVVEIGPELHSLHAPTELADLLLDLSRRRDPG